VKLTNCYDAGGMVIDPASGYAYVGAMWSVKWIAGVVNRISLSNFEDAGTIILRDGEVFPQSPVIDPAP
jgi:hypothetical protein